MRSIRLSTPTSARGIRTRALAVTATVALLAVSLGAGAVLADDGRDHRNAENTFTKWITGPGAPPALANMGGVVGGDVGDGAFSGQVLTKTPTSTGAVIDAIYHFDGSRHSFTAAVHVVQTGVNAVISGVVTDGWLKGNLVEAGYEQITCDHDGTTSTCFQGWLDILRGTKRGD
jgi:hypothetical protein